MNFHNAVICCGFILTATLILTVILEIIKYDGLYNGSLMNSVIENYKVNIMQILYSLLWIGGIIVAIEMILIVYDGARMRYRQKIEIFERLEDFYCRQLPQITLVYSKPPEGNGVQQPQQQQQPLLLPQQPQQQGPHLVVEAPQAPEEHPPPPRRSSRTRRRSIY